MMRIGILLANTEAVRGPTTSAVHKTKDEVIAMTDRITWISHKGKKILYANYGGLAEQEYLAALEETQAEILKQPSGSNTLLLTDMTDTHITPATRDKGKDMSVKIRAAGKATSPAIVGITGVQKIIAQAIKRDAYFAKSVAEAKEHLASQ
jgi:hypothetical protein